MASLKNFISFIVRKHRWNVLKSIQRYDLFYAMNLYSITGVPLLSSLSKTKEREYGFNDYNEKSMRKI